MPSSIKFDMPPAGYVLTSARAEEQASVQFCEFTSTEDGQHFIKRLEGFPSEILAKLDNRISPSHVDSMLAIICRDGTATVYLNELSQTSTMRISRPIRKGERVSKSDVVDIDRLELGVEIRDDVGFLFLFSIGWRKGLFYDFGPIGGPDPQPRAYDVNTVLGQAYCHVLFQERFSISDDEWSLLFEFKWFAFAALRHETIEKLISYIRSGWNPDELINEVASELSGGVAEMLDSWRTHSSFLPHIEILERAIERFQAGDYISCTGLLFPRIEGLLRTHHRGSNSPDRPSPDNLVSKAVASKIDNEKCLLLPDRFARFLTEVYFANFNPVAQTIDVSRHSVAHGVADPAAFDQKSAIIGLLVVHQLFYFLPSANTVSPVTVATNA